MARYDFGGTLADFVVTSHRLGTLDTLALSAATLTMWSAQSGGTRYTDLVLNGSAVTSIAVGSDGQVPKFQGPDAVTEMWADGGAGRVRVVTLQGAPGPAGPASTVPGPPGQTGPQGATGVAGPQGPSGPIVGTWAPSTAYTANQIIRNPSGELVMAKAAFTSGSTFDATNWDFVPASSQIKRVNVTTSAPTSTSAAGVLEIPDTSWMETHDHLNRMPAYSLTLRPGNYVHPWHSAPTSTLNLGAFSGALYQRFSFAQFYHPDNAAYVSFHAQVTTVGTGVVRFGIYDHDFANGSPGATFIDLGTIDATVLGVQNITLNFSLTRGFKWLAFVWQGTNTTGPVLAARIPDHGPAGICGATASLDLGNRRTTMNPASPQPAGALPAGPFINLTASGQEAPAVGMHRAVV